MKCLEDPNHRDPLFSDDDSLDPERRERAREEAKRARAHEDRRFQIKIIFFMLSAVLILALLNDDVRVALPYLLGFSGLCFLWGLIAMSAAASGGSRVAELWQSFTTWEGWFDRLWDSKWRD